MSKTNSNTLLDNLAALPATIQDAVNDADHLLMGLGVSKQFDQVLPRESLAQRLAAELSQADDADLYIASLLIDLHAVAQADPAALGRIVQDSARLLADTLQPTVPDLHISTGYTGQTVKLA